MPPDPSPSKIICVGRNYRDHSRELGNEPPTEPLLFLKPPSAVVGDGDPIRIPPGVGRVDFEGEIAFVVGRKGTRVREEEALDHLSAVAPMNDVTCRELQARDGQWSRAKGFDTFCPLGPPLSLAEVEVEGLRVETRLNGELVQEGRLADVIFPVPFLVAFISRIMTLEPGDVIATGTPAGVAPMVPWDEVEVRVPGVGRTRNPVRGGFGAPWPYGAEKERR